MAKCCRYYFLPLFQCCKQWNAYYHSQIWQIAHATNSVQKVRLLHDDFILHRKRTIWLSFFPCGREVRRIRQDVFEFLGVRLVLPLQEEHHRQHDVPAALPDDLRHPPHLLLPLDLQPGIVTIKFESEAPTFNDWLESSHVRFLAHDYLDGPRQRRAFWALHWHGPSCCHLMETTE